MKKFVTILFIVLPLILLVAIFAVTGTAQISAKVPVSGIQISNKGDGGVFMFDMADYSAPLYESDLGIVVTPYIADNKTYTLSIIDPETNLPTDIVEKDETGAFRLNDIGKAKLVYSTVDGGYSDSVILNIVSSKALNISLALKDKGGADYTLAAGTDTDFVANISGGEYSLSSLPYPLTTTISNISFVSDNTERLQIDDTGKLRALFAGQTIVRTSANGSDGSVFSKTILFDVSNTATNGLLVNGITSSHTIVPKSSTQATVFLDAPVDNESQITLECEDIEAYEIEKLSNVSQTAYKANISFKDTRTQDSIQIKLTASAASTTFYIDFADYNFEIFSTFNAQNSEDLVVLLNEQTTFAVTSSPAPKNARYEWTISNPRIQASQTGGAYCDIIAGETGETSLSVHVVVLDEFGNDTEEEYTLHRTLICTPKYTSLLFLENSETYGLSNRLAVANKSYDKDGELKDETYSCKFLAYNGKDLATSFEDLIFESDAPNIAQITSLPSGVEISVHGTGKVTVSARHRYGDRFRLAPAYFTFDAVDGVYCSSYEDIMRASKQQRIIVLAQDISLGENLFDTSEDGSRTQKYSDARMLEILQSETKTLKTTADWTYYKNLGEEHPLVRYCFEFTNDLYGNGHTIDADNIINMLDATSNLYDFALFKGPLDFVSTSKEGIKLAAVKGQDNIVFLARKDGITINNVTLKSVNDTSLYSGDEIDLSLFNNAGTTLEIMGNVSLNYSRVMNGRTVVRVFGRDEIDTSLDVDVDLEKINVTIDGCMLQNAREFILKIGTNRSITGTKQIPAPALLDENGNEYDKHNSPACDDYISDDYFVSHYVLTDVTLKDSILKTSGLFSIGIESHFAGQMLAGGDAGLGVTYVLSGWRKLAGTSYPAILHLVGDVVLDDYKSLDAIDSSTLIESVSLSQFNLTFLNLNIKEMILAVQRFGGDQYADIVKEKDGELYAHGGIALYGGGKNYSIIDMSQYTFKQLSQYCINLDILAGSDEPDLRNQGLLLPAAAGVEDFRFLMYKTE